MPLHIDNRTIESVEAATLTLIVETEDLMPVTRILDGRQTTAKQYGPAYASALLSLEIIADRDEEDCTPTFRAPIDGASFPARMSQLAGSQLIVAVAHDASYGVHGPTLEASVLELIDWPAPDTVNVRWTAEYDNWDRGPPRRIPFLYEGEVAFTGIEMRVKQEKDAITILSHVLPRLDLSAFAMSLGREIILEPPVQTDRTHWREVFWRPKAK